MVRLESLKKSGQFKKVLKEKKFHTNYFSIYASKNFFDPTLKNNLLISFVMKKKKGNEEHKNYKYHEKYNEKLQTQMKKRKWKYRPHTINIMPRPVGLRHSASPIWWQFAQAKVKLARISGDGHSMREK